MNSTQLFDLLLEHRKITLVATSSQAQSLRVFFIRKFKDYKEQMTKLGFLDPEYESFVVSMEILKEEDAGKVRFFLRPKQRQATEFTVLLDPTVE